VSIERRFRDAQMSFQLLMY